MYLVCTLAVLLSRSLKIILIPIFLCVISNKDFDVLSVKYEIVAEKNFMMLVE